MGSVSLKIGDGTARFRRATLCSSLLHLLMLASLLTTNLFALYAFTTPTPTPPHPHKNLSLISDHVSLILDEIAASQLKLNQIQRNLAGYPTLDPSNPHLAPDLALFLSRHPLPLGPDSRSHITHLVSSIAHACPAPDLLTRFMAYTPLSLCPRDAPLSHTLISKGCDPLPRRRCLTRRPKPSPPIPPLDPQIWIKPRGKNDFLIDEILNLGTPIRVGLDIAATAATFAARMADRNVTIITSTAAAGHEIAARGLIPLLTTPAQRFPFQDSVFDLVHVGRGLDEGGVAGEGRARPEALEFLMFDMDRVLRAKGLLWIDNYLCVDEERKRVVTKLVERFGYKKMKWVVGEKAGGGKAQLYLSAVLQKPARG